MVCTVYCSASTVAVPASLQQLHSPAVSLIGRVMGIEYSSEDHQDVPLTGMEDIVLPVSSLLFSLRFTNKPGGSAVLRKVCKEGFIDIETQGEWVKLQVGIMIWLRQCGCMNCLGLLIPLV